MAVKAAMLLSVFACFTVAQAAQMTTQRNLAGGGLLESVSMLPNGTEGWAAGQFGKVLHTVDGGTTWVVQVVPAGLTMSALIDVAAVDATHVWIVGRSDGAGTPIMLFYNGSAWTKVTLPIPVTRPIMSIKMVSTTVGYAVSQDGSVLGTSDGVTWSVLSMVMHPQAGFNPATGLPVTGSAPLMSIAVDPLNPQTLWVLGDLGVNKSVDGGLTWGAELTAGKFTDLDLNTITGAPIGGRHISVYGNIIVVGESFWKGILSSQDGGVTWTHTPWLAASFLRPQMIDAFVGYALDVESPDLNQVFKTTDGGVSWNVVAVAGGPAWAVGMHFIDLNTGWVVGQNDLVVKLNLTPGAVAATIQKDLAGGGLLESVSMLPNGTEGWSVGQFGKVLHTVDGGTTWVVQVVPVGLTMSALIDVVAVDATHVWIVGRSDATGRPVMLFYNGTTWTKVTLPISVIRPIMSVKMVSATVGYAVSQDGSVLGTSDGLTWSVLSTVMHPQAGFNPATGLPVAGPAPLMGIAVDPLNPQILWVLGDLGVNKSVDGGLTWGAELTAGKFTDLDLNTITGAPIGGRHISVYGNTIVVGESFWSGILSSQDGGVTWTHTPWISPTLLRPQMLDALVGYALDVESPDLNQVYKTTDGGVTWNSVAIAGGPAWAAGMYFIDVNTGWVVGQNDLIVKLNLTPGAVAATIQKDLAGGGLLESVSMLPNGTEGWSVGQFGKVLHTVDGGTTWVNQVVPAGLTLSALIDVSAVDATHVWVVGRSDVSGTPLMLFYNGAAWSSVVVPASLTQQLRSIDMISASVGYAVSRDGSVLKTINGMDWTIISTITSLKSDSFPKLTVPAPVALASISVDPLNIQSVWALSDSGIFHSTDGGVSWGTELTAGKFTVFGLSLVNGNMGGVLPSAAQWFRGRHISVYGNTIVASDNGSGSVWGNDPNSQAFNWIQTGSGILSSQNGGITWTYQPEIGAGGSLKPQMIDALVGYALDVESPDLNQVYKTTDGGVTWNSVAIAGGPAWAAGMYFIDVNTGWIVGQNDLIVKISFDSDGDGVPDAQDAFPFDAAASVDTDGDGHPDAWNTGKVAADSTSIPPLTLDAFPNDATRWLFTPAPATSILLGVSLGDVNGNGSGDFAVLGKRKSSGKYVVRVKDPNTVPHLIREIGLNGAYKPVQMVRMPDVNGNGSADIAVLEVDPATGLNRQIQVKDGLTGAKIVNIQLNRPLKPVQMVVLPDANGNGSADIAVLEVDPATGLNRQIQVKDGRTGALIQNIRIKPTVKPHQMVSVGLINGVPALAVSEVDAVTGKNVQIQVKNARTGALIRNIHVNPNYKPHMLVVLPDVNGNGSPELALSEVHATTGKNVQIQVKDAKTGAKIRNIPVKPTLKPHQLVSVGNVGGTPAIALSEVDAVTGKNVQIQVKYAGSGALIRNIRVNSTTKPHALIVLADINGNGSSELALSEVNAITGKNVQVQVKDAQTGAKIRNIPMNPNYTPLGLGTGPDSNGNGVAEIGLLEVNGVGNVQIQIKDPLTGAKVINLPYPNF